MAYKVALSLYHGADVPVGTVNGGLVEVWEFDQNQFVAMLKCTLKSGAGNLDVKFQTLLPDGTTWSDVGVAFAQKSGTGVEAKVVTLPAACRVVAVIGGTAVYDIDVWASGRGVV